MPIESDQVEDMPELPQRSRLRAMARGAAGHCPKCGDGALFAGYLKVADKCGTCAEALHHQRADDAPPYFTIFAVGHIVVPGLLLTERLFDWPMWGQIVLWSALTVVLALLFLRPIKGALIGLQWALYMHGFDPRSEPEAVDDIATVDPARS